jgi:hypothetical protein
VSPVRYELGFISQKTAFFIVTAVRPSNLTQKGSVSALALLLIRERLAETHLQGNVQSGNK